jgi:hypothetical protein
MSTFTSMVSKFAHETQGESSRGNSTDNGRTDRKRTIKNEDEEQEGVYQELTTQVRKSQRLSAASISGPLISRVISADSVKTRPHHKRAVTEVEKKEETTVTVHVRSHLYKTAQYTGPPSLAEVNNMLHYSFLTASENEPKSKLGVRTTRGVCAPELRT